MSRSVSTIYEAGGRLRGDISPVKQSNLSSSGFCRVQDTNEAEQLGVVASGAQGIKMPSENIIGASSLIIDSSLNRVEAMLKNLCQNRIGELNVAKTTSRHREAPKSARGRPLPRRITKCRVEAIRSTKQKAVNEGLGEIVKVCEL
uniref:Uncharacterized protein n=1 Tax=Parascaris univalens TaxID=6257 RepID=A0A915A7L9_PARUN